MSHHESVSLNSLAHQQQAILTELGTIRDNERAMMATIAELVREVRAIAVCTPFISRSICSILRTATDGMTTMGSEPVRSGGSW
jgi:hypothetical protein